MLPDLVGSVRESVQQIDLAAQGLRIMVPIPGFNFPTVVGPFNYFDARANFTESLSLTSFHNWRSSQENARSAEFSIKDSRDLVTLAVSASYLQLLLRPHAYKPLTHRLQRLRQSISRLSIATTAA